MTWTLYNRRGSGGFAAEAALALAGLPYELIEIESLPSTPLPESFRATNPWRQVPVLILEDGTMLTETVAILCHIALSRPGLDVAPPPGSSAFARQLRWTVFLGTNVYEGVLRRVYPGRYTTAPDGRVGVRAAALQRNADAFAVLEAELRKTGPFLLGEAMSLADVYLAMLFMWHRNHAAFPSCQRLTNTVAAHPTIAPIWQRNFDHRTPVRWGRL